MDWSTVSGGHSSKWGDYIFFSGIVFFCVCCNYGVFWDVERWYFLVSVPREFSKVAEKWDNMEHLSKLGGCIFLLFRHFSLCLLWLFGVLGYRRLILSVFYPLWVYQGRRIKWGTEAKVATIFVFFSHFYLCLLQLFGVFECKTLLFYLFCPLSYFVDFISHGTSSTGSKPWLQRVTQAIWRGLFPVYGVSFLISDEYIGAPEYEGINA